MTSRRVTARRSPTARAAMIVIAALLAGCATASPSLWDLNRQSDCERRGGVWRPTLGLREYQSDGGAAM